MQQRQLGFASRARSGLRAAQTSELIAKSRENNARDDVTGVLVYSGDSFLSIVEGSESAITALWRRLLFDDRHCAIVSLFDVIGRGRWFDGWRAGYVPEVQLGAVIAGWRGVSRAVALEDIESMRAFCAAARAF